jgi:cyclopropane fatty-acyl-phospholipid synthase-like methyltransferase
MTDLPLHRSRELTKDEKLAEVRKLSRAYRRTVQKRRDRLRAHYPELLHEIDERFRAASMDTLSELTDWLKLSVIEVASNFRPVLFNYLCARLVA